MQRITGPNAIDIGSGRLGFRDRNLGAGLAGTKVLAAWLNPVQEEIARAVELAGLSLLDGNFEQLFQAICRLGAGAGRNLTSGTHNLTADQMGFTTVSAATAPTVINLPNASAAGGRPMELTLSRWEAAYSVTVNAAAGQQVEYGTSITIPGGETITLRSNGLDAWMVTAEAARSRSVSASVLHYRFPGGVLVQAADFTTSNSADVWVAFPEAFVASNSYRLLIGHNSNNTLGSVGSVDRTAAGFNGTSYAAGGRTVALGSYFAIGM